jgi:DTW domain-containing protein
MRSMTPPGAPGRCPRCMLLSDWCMCELIGDALPSRPEVLVVRHHWEAFKSTGTARLAALALSNLRILDMAAENPEPIREGLRGLEDAWLLYPDGATPGSIGDVRPRTLVVLDGTWKQTRKMLRRLPELSRLPRFSLPPSDESRDRLREAPRPGARSTLESIADALTELDSSAQGSRLLELHRSFVDRTRRSRGQLDAS